jgi:hypothetical protein
MLTLFYDTIPLLASVESPVLDGEEGRGLSRIYSVFLASSFRLAIFPLSTIDIYDKE